MDQDLKVFLEGLEARMQERFNQVEGLSGDIRLLAEGVMGLTERLERYQAETAHSFQELKAMLALDDRPDYHHLDDRAQSLEADVQSLNRRMKVFEGRAEQQTGDVLDAIRKKFGPPRA